MEPIAELTEEEISAVKQFRYRISDLLPELSDYAKHDLGLLRFLRARDLHLDRAESMLRKHLQWKTDNRMNEIMNYKTDPTVEENFKFKMTGVDKKGRLVCFVPIGKWNIGKVLNAGLRDHVLTYGKQGFQLPLLVGDKLFSQNCYISQVHGVVDFEGFSLKNYMSTDVVGLIREYIEIMEANYPENLGCAIVINAPKIFQVFWTIVKPWLAPHTLSKVHGIYDSNKENWMKVLLDDIDPDCIPSEYGGALTGCLPYTFSHDLDQAIPKFIVHPEEEMTTIFIEAGQKFDVVLNMEQGSHISWNFKSEDWDIGFRVDFVEADKELVKACRVDSHRFTQKGLLSCQEKGNYTLTFDNSHSRFRGKTVKYVVRTYTKDEFSPDLLSPLSAKYSLL